MRFKLPHFLTGQRSASTPGEEPPARTLQRHVDPPTARGPGQWLPPPLAAESGGSSNDTWGSLHSHIAAARGELVTLLTEEGGLTAGNVEARDPVGGRTLLHWAAACGRFTEAAAASGPLYASEADRLAAVRCLHALLRSGASLEAADDRGNTAAHLAAAVGNLTALHELAAAGCDLTARNHADETPFDVAWRAGMEAAVEMLPELEQRARQGCLMPEATLPDLADPGEAGTATPRDRPAERRAPCTPLHQLPAASSSSLAQLLICPITQEHMRDPVVAADGHTYERAAIEDWIRRREVSGHLPTSPCSRVPLTDRSLRPNLVARSLAAELREAGVLREE